MNGIIWKRCTAFTALAAVVVLAAASPAWAITEKTQGAVQYMSGGVGDEELAAIKAAMPAYSLVLTFAVKEPGKADFLSDVRVTVTDASGQTVLDTKAEGPYLLAKLPVGSYTVTAVHANAPIVRKMTLRASGNGPQVFEW